MTDTPETRDIILNAAEARFAVQGFAATPIKSIAADARVNSALLYYYFADKEALYATVISRLIERLAVEMAHAMEGATAPAEIIQLFVRRQGELFAAHPRLIKLLGRELVDHEAAHAQDAIRHLAATTFERLHRTVRAGQRAGLFRADFDPRFAAISIVAQTAYFHFARPAVEILLNDGRALPRRISAAFAEHVANFSLAALAPPRAAPKRRTARIKSRKKGLAS